MDDDAHLEFVMPFVACASAGGRYDDDAYVAGYECGRVDALLGQGPRSASAVVHEGNLEQLDLIAMNHGYIIVKEHEEYGLVNVRFVAEERDPV
jgi:hypothetical protein